MKRGPWRTTIRRALRDAIKLGFGYKGYGIHCPKHRKEPKHAAQNKSD